MQKKRNGWDCVPTTPTRAIRPTRRSVSGRYTLRNGNAVAYESTLERDFIVRQDFRLDVRNIVSQPVQIPFTASNGRSYTYTPDFLIIFEPSRTARSNAPTATLVEVKPRDQWREHWRKWSTKWKAARRHAMTRGWTFHIHDETRIRNLALRNIQHLQRFANPRQNNETDEQIVTCLSRNGPTPLAQILDAHLGNTDRHEATAALWHLVATRRLDCDINNPLSEDTKVWTPEQT